MTYGPVNGDITENTFQWSMPKMQHIILTKTWAIQ